MHRDTGTYTANKAHQKMLMFIPAIASLKERNGKATLHALARSFQLVEMPSLLNSSHIILSFPPAITPPEVLCP